MGVIWDDLLETVVVDNLPSVILALISSLQNGLHSVMQKIKATISHTNSWGILVLFCFRCIVVVVVIVVCMIGLGVFLLFFFLSVFFSENQRISTCFV